jgi:DNA-binding CsgD family transcriptional regulator
MLAHFAANFNSHNRMKKNTSIEEVFFKYLSQFKFEEKLLDYSVVEKHAMALQTLSDIGNSGTGIFDFCKRQIVFYSSNFGRLLGYAPSDYEALGQDFFAEKIHPEDARRLSFSGVSVMKIFSSFSSDEKLNHKVINEYRMLNAENQYVRMIEQYQVLELDRKGQIWLTLNIVDVSPNQGAAEESKSQLLNFRTGKIIPMEITQTVQHELTKREVQILKMVKDGYLSKEISNRLSISLHTVNTHRQRFLEKLGANNSLEAIMFASKFGLLE